MKERPQNAHQMKNNCQVSFIPPTTFRFRQTKEKKKGTEEYLQKYHGNEDEEEVKDGSAARELGQTVSK